MMDRVKERIEKLRKSKNVLILAHNYQRPEVQEIADFVGDSLELARTAAKADAEIIVICGVDFMAETTAILNPDKKVLIPDPGAICPMAQALSPNELKREKEKNRDAEVLLYINTLADCKALADCVCTSSNAAVMVEAMDSDTIIFGPDHNLSRYLEKRTSKEIITLPEYGLCPVHHQISDDDLLTMKIKHPEAGVVVHPECVIEVQDMADHVTSTSGMIKYCKEAKEEEFLIGTEVGHLYQLKKKCKGKRFYPISETAVCPQMKMHTLKKVEKTLELEKHLVVVEKDVAEKARRTIERMLSLS